ncbi:universal stress protein [Catellatospora chokoriensis]|uniref:Universal stress protein n=1 Tax=Catellatospora chokoriensis TaxID=310353 RepID=A0A8J3JZK2_9ACTN|nr:universal stress protein [Catellatospora chokoriensis]GIF93996.1 universal stress protein [Catellatospora chokoriensis]
MATRQIVVGVDGSQGGRRAFAWALEQAAAGSATVQAVLSWRRGDPRTSLADARACQELAQLTLDREVQAQPARHGVSVAAGVVEGQPADVLVAAARNADLLVLGSHGHGRAHHTILGSVSEACIANAPCPVVVIPVPGPPRPVAAAVPATEAGSR